MSTSRVTFVAFLVLAAAVSGCAAAGPSGAGGKDKVKTLAAPDTMVTLAVTMPDGTTSELVVADGDLATVKIDEAHTYSCTPKIAGPDRVTVAVALLEMGDKPAWKPVETLEVAANAPAATTKANPSFKLALAGIKKVK